MRLFFDPDLASSYREISSRLGRVAAGDRAMERLAAGVASRYERALLTRTGDRAEPWQTFIVSLNAFVSLVDSPSADREILRRLVDENVDLLERQNARIA